MAYTVILQPSAERALAKFDKPTQQRLVSKLESLRNNPRGPDTQKLAGPDNFYRVRVGQVRIVYTIADDRLIVLVVRIAKRDEVYKR